MERTYYEPNPFCSKSVPSVMNMFYFSLRLLPSTPPSSGWFPWCTFNYSTSDMELQGNYELFFSVAISTNAALPPHINHCGLKHAKVKYRYLLLLVPPPSPLGMVKAFNTFTNFGENSNLETSSSAFSFIFTPLTWRLEEWTQIFGMEHSSRQGLQEAQYYIHHCSLPETSRSS